MAKRPSYAQIILGPRVVGGTYLCAYWGKTYKVQAIEMHDDIPWLTVLWEDGRTTQHCTSWDKRDKVI